MRSASALRIDDMSEYAAFSASQSTTSGGVWQGTEVSLDYGNFWRHFENVAGEPWQERVAQRLKVLQGYTEGWDSYAAIPIHREVIAFVRQTLLPGIMSSRTSLPQIVPLQDGGLQLEWHENGMDIELAIESPSQCELYVHDRLSGMETVTVLHSNFAPLVAAVAKMTSRDGSCR